MPIYKDNHCNRIAGRVGKEYGKKAKKKAPAVKKKAPAVKKKVKFIVEKKESKPNKMDKNPHAMGDPKGFSSSFGVGKINNSEQLLSALGYVEPNIVNQIMGQVKNPADGEMWRTTDKPLYIQPPDYSDGSMGLKQEKFVQVKLRGVKQGYATFDYVTPRYKYGGKRKDTYRRKVDDVSVYGAKEAKSMYIEDQENMKARSKYYAGEN